MFGGFCEVFVCLFNYFGHDQLRILKRSFWLSDRERLEGAGGTRVGRRKGLPPDLQAENSRTYKDHFAQRSGRGQSEVCPWERRALPSRQSILAASESTNQQVWLKPLFSGAPVTAASTALLGTGLGDTAAIQAARRKPYALLNSSTA